MIKKSNIFMKVRKKSAKPNKDKNKIKDKIFLKNFWEIVYSKNLMRYNKKSTNF